MQSILSTLFPCITTQKFFLCQSTIFHSKFCKNEEHAAGLIYFVRATCILCFFIIFHPFENFLEKSHLVLPYLTLPSPCSLDPSQRERPSGYTCMFYLSVAKIALYLLSFNSSAVFFSPLSLSAAFWIELVLLARL